MFVLPLSLLSLLLARTSLANPLPYDVENAKNVAWALDVDSSNGDSLLVPRLVNGAPPAVLLDYSNKITFPTAGSVFTAGGECSIEWDATLPPGINASEVPQYARVVLGFFLPGGVGGENLLIDENLGSHIPLYTAPYKYTFTLPANLTTRSTYILSLQGSSGNISPEFTINAIASGGGGGGGSTSSAAPSTPASTTTPADSSTSSPSLAVSSSSSSPSSPSTSTSTNTITDTHTSTVIVAPSTSTTSTPAVVVPVVTIFSTLGDGSTTALTSAATAIPSGAVSLQTSGAGAGGASRGAGAWVVGAVTVLALAVGMA